MHAIIHGPSSYSNALELLLRQCYTRPAYACLHRSCRQHSVLSNSKEYEIPGDVQKVAILGGGITGLAAAHFLSKASPNTRITLFEGGKRLGGWLHSQMIETANGKVIFEKGPRTLRPSVPNGVLTLDLVWSDNKNDFDDRQCADQSEQIRNLGLEGQILSTSKNSVAAQNRYVYYPDHLVRMPGPGGSVFENLIGLFSEPVFSGLISAFFRDNLENKRGESLKDESIASFFARRLNSQVADNVASALMHGIYAGDIEKLSVRSILPQIWDYEGRFGSVTSGIKDSFENARFSAPDCALLKELSERLHPGLAAAAASSVYTLKGGLAELAHGLEASLVQNPMVEIKRGTLVREIRVDEERDRPVCSIL